MGPEKTAVCFVSSVRYRQPLDRTSAKKFQALHTLGELFVIGFSETTLPHRFTEYAHFSLLPNLPLRILRYTQLVTIGSLLAVWFVVRHGVAVLIAQSPYEGVAAAVAKKISNLVGRKVALVVENHGDFEEAVFLLGRVPLPRVYRFLLRCAAGFALRHADVLRAESNSSRRQLERWAPGKRMHQFLAWTDIEAFLRAGADEKDPGTQDIVYAGVLTPLKGVHHLIAVFSQILKDFPRARLVAVGAEENQAYAAQLKEQVRRLGLDGRVKFVRKVPQVELAAWMRGARVFVLPSYSEGIPRVVFEAMAAGTPVVASAVGGVPEVVREGETGFLVPPGDEVALGARIRWMLEHPNEACEMGHRARAFAEKCFSTEAYVQGHAEMLEDAIESIRRSEVGGAIKSA